MHRIIPKKISKEYGIENNLLRKVKRFPNNIGADTGLRDRNGTVIRFGDHVRLTYKPYNGIILLNEYSGEINMLWGKYPYDDKYDFRSYWKAWSIPRDNGMRMHLEVCNAS